MMGGEIEVESDEGSGSTFRFTRRVRGRPPGRPPNGASRGARGDAGPGGGRQRDARAVLVEEDEALGFKAQSAARGNRASPRCSKPRGGEPFSLALMDWRMPGMDGLEAARRIKDIPVLAATPLIIMTTPAPTRGLTGVRALWGWSGSW